MSRRMRGTLSFSYFAEAEQYPDGTTSGEMARMDEEVFEEDPDALLRAIERADEIEIAITPGLLATADADDGGYGYEDSE